METMLYIYIKDIRKLLLDMNESGYYPLGAEHDPEAPWNQVDNPEREIEVLVSITLSKTFKVKVSDYTITDSGKDEDGEYFEELDFSDCNLKEAVESQIKLPQNEFSDWTIDDFEVVPE